MLEKSDEIILQAKGITSNQINDQLNSFKNGFPFLKIISAAEINNGIIQFSENEIKDLLSTWDNYLQSEAAILKFVPASGAASRMFKDLFEFLDGVSDVPTNEFEKKFFAEIQKFAFYDDLNNVCLKNHGATIEQLIADNKYKNIVSNLLNSEGLNYGALPKGLLKFHNYASGNRTPMQEHLAEGALYASNVDKDVNIHFTVSKEHRDLFENHFNETYKAFESEYNVNFKVSFSEQKPSTDTVAADENNLPFRESGKIIFRPGGHGALIENLNDLDADVIFIKNIDNVVPDSIKEQTITYKKVIAGILVKLQKQSFEYLKVLENNIVSDSDLAKISKFCKEELNNQHPDIDRLSKDELKTYLYNKLNRPMRICGMVKNVGEPGGGPFLTVNADGTVSPQILESSQIDLTNPVDKDKMLQSTHFNPVDLVCAVKNYRGEKFDLLKHVDKSTGFISLKSKNGKELKALELPGLWNGAMSDWNTIFVEVPIETFNPVKTVNDLLRPQHQA